MIRTRLMMVSLLLATGAATGWAQAINALTPQEKSQGWELLFDGKTLSGWHPAVPAPAPPAAARGQAARGQAPVAPAPVDPNALPQVGSAPKPCGPTATTGPAGASHWEVIDGSVMPCGEPIGYLATDKTYKNFVLSVEFNCAELANSGLYFRSPGGLGGGYEVQIWKRQPAGYNTGSIVGTAKTARDFFLKPDQWNRLQVTAEGDHIVVVLNGETTLDIHDARFPEGAFRIQYQQYPIQFRNMKVRPLPPILIAHTLGR